MPSSWLFSKVNPLGKSNYLYYKTLSSSEPQKPQTGALWGGTYLGIKRFSWQRLSLICLSVMTQHGTFYEKDKLNLPFFLKLSEYGFCIYMYKDMDKGNRSTVHGDSASVCLGKVKESEAL